MRLKSALAAISIAVALGLASQGSAEAGWCRGAPRGWCGPQPVRHFLYFPNYYNVYYMATFAPDPYPYAYMPYGYWPRYQRPYSRYARRYWSRPCRGGCGQAYAPAYGGYLK